MRGCRCRTSCGPRVAKVRAGSCRGVKGLWRHPRGARRRPQGRGRPEIHALIGQANGAGKTTLMRSIPLLPFSGLYAPVADAGHHQAPRPRHRGRILRADLSSGPRPLVPDHQPVQGAFDEQNLRLSLQAHSPGRLSVRARARARHRRLSRRSCQTAELTKFRRRRPGASRASRTSKAATSLWQQQRLVDAARHCAGVQAAGTAAR